MNTTTKTAGSPKDLRIEPRKLLRCQANVLLKNGTHMSARTVDVSLNGICLMVPENIAVGQSCAMAFQTVMNGKVLSVQAVAQAVYNICVGTSGFRVGFQFTEIDSASKIAISQMLD